jgi:hypothetical protein
MPTQADPLGKQAGESVQDHKQRVVDASRAHADAQKVAARASNTRPPEGFPKPPGTPSNIPEFMKDKFGIVTPQEPDVKQVPTSNAPASTNGSSNEPEWQKVAREKGWKDINDVFRSYDALEKEFHARNQQPRPAPQAPAPMPAPQYVMPYPQYQQPPFVQQLARRHNIPLEDAERLLPFVAEISQAAADNATLAERARFEPVVIDLNRKVKRQEDINAVMSDPAMRVPRVQVEVSKVFMENPSVFQYEAQPYQWALDRALRNIAQESLRDEQVSYVASGHPASPPVTAGSGTRTSGGEPSRGGPQIDLAGNYFKLKTAAEKLDVLRQMGVAAEA